MRAIVKGDLHPRLSAGEEQAAPLGVLADGTGEVVVGDTIGDPRPGGAEVGGLVEIGMEVVVLVAIGGDVGDGRIMRGRH